MEGLQQEKIECYNTYNNECIGDNNGEMRYDAYGIPTRNYCDKCYHEGKYPYRKDEYYDYLNAGERLY